MTSPDIPPAPRTRMAEIVKPLLVFAAFFGGWFVLNRWVLPRLGIAT